MSLNQDIARYIHRETGGMVNLPFAVIQGVISLVLAENRSDLHAAKLGRYNSLKNAYELIFTAILTREQANELIQYSLNNPPAEKFYRYEIFEDSNFIGFIYTANPDLHNMPLKTGVLSP